MKKIIYCALLGALSLGFVACDDEDEKNDNSSTNSDGSQTTVAEQTYNGTIYVEFKGQNNATEDIDCGVLKDENKRSIDLSLYQVKFVPQMPLTIDLTIPGISYEEGESGILFSADSIAPTMGGNPYPDYAAKNLNGKIVGDSLFFDVTFGNYPTNYKGKLVK